MKLLQQLLEQTDERRWRPCGGSPTCEMNVRDIMTSNPITISSNASLRKALKLMDEHQVKHLPVNSTSGHLVGIISDRDCRHALNSPFVLREKWQDEELARQLQVRAVMSAAPIVVEPYAPAAEAARLMLNHRIGCLPVMRVETLVGIVTRSDLLVAFMTIHRHYEHLIDLDSNQRQPVPTTNGHNGLD